MYLSAVEINCSQDWLMVYVSPDAQDGNNSYIFSDELILGQGCPATKIHTYRYDFVYLVSDCGIRTKVRMLLSVTLLHVLSCYVLPADTKVLYSNRIPDPPDIDLTFGLSHLSLPDYLVNCLLSTSEHRSE